MKSLFCPLNTTQLKNFMIITHNFLINRVRRNINYRHIRILNTENSRNLQILLQLKFLRRRTLKFSRWNWIHVNFHPFVFFDMGPVFHEVSLTDHEFFNLFVNVLLDKAFGFHIQISQSQSSLNNNDLINQYPNPLIRPLGQNHPPPWLNLNYSQLLTHWTNKSLISLQNRVLNHVLICHAIDQLLNTWLPKLFSQQRDPFPINLNLFYLKILTQRL